MKLFMFKCGEFKNKTWFLRQLVVSVSCSISGLISANCRTWLEPFASDLMPSNMDSSTYGWLISILSLSSAVFCIPAGILSDRCGRKRTLLLIPPLCLLSWVLVAISNEIPIFYLMRVLQGVIDAISQTLSGVYIAEISSPKIRGTFHSILALSAQFGFLFTCIISTYFEYQTFIYISMSLPVIFFITFILMPESPYYFLMKENKNDASKVLSWLRASKNVEEELASIQAAVEADMSRKAGFKDLFATRSDRRAFLIIQIVTITSRFSGMIGLIQYAKLTFEKAPLLWVTADQLSMIMAVVLCISCFIPIFLIDIVGKRKLLIISSIGSALANFTICVFYYLLEVHSLNVGPYVWAMYLGVLSLSVFSNMGALQLRRGIQAEFFPSHTRAVGGGVTGVLAAVEVFIAQKLYIVFMEIFGIYMNFLIYFVVSIISDIFIMKYVPESAGKTLQEINKQIGDSTEK